jgi:hypothetical protein
MKRFAFLAIPFVFAACGDNKAVEQPIDAPPTPIDSQAIDAPLPIDARVIDASNIDAPPAVTYSRHHLRPRGGRLNQAPPARSSARASRSASRSARATRSRRP